jgi:membrane fusion protein (multidrug efflux system)
VKVEINVPERFLGQIQTGQELELAVAAHPGRKFAGKVYFVAAQIDEITRTALVKALIANPQRELKPGMFASLDLTLQVRDRAILIPESCLMFSGDEARVFVVGTNQTAQMRPVRLGLRLPGMVEVTAGLAEQELVVREGLQKVVPGMRVRQAEPAGTSPPAQRTNSVPAGA